MRLIVAIIALLFLPLTCTQTVLNEYSHLNTQPYEIQRHIVQQGIEGTRNNTELKKLLKSVSEVSRQFNRIMKDPVTQKILLHQRLSFIQNEIDIDTHYKDSHLNVLKKGIEDKDANGNTFLLLAALKKDPNFVSLALQAGAHINTVNNIGETAIMNAMNAGEIGFYTDINPKSLETAQVLLQDPTINLSLIRAGHNPTTALELAIEQHYDHEDRDALNLHKRLISLLLDSGANVNQIINENNGSALALASFYNLPYEIVQLLLERGANPRFHDMYRSSNQEVRDLIESYRKPHHHQ